MSESRRGLTEHEIASLERMVMADQEAAHLVMVDMIGAACNGAGMAGVEIATMVGVLDKLSEMLVDKAIARGGCPLAPIAAPRKAV
jgi:hypothetical protein